MNLTNEEIRTKVAESMGWKCVGGKAFPECWTHDDHGFAWQVADLPSYPEDLNACASFEATLTDEEQAEYWKNLVTLCNEAAREQNNFRLVGIFYQITAKPKMRCLAYLKTKGLIP